MSQTKPLNPAARLQLSQRSRAWLLTLCAFMLVCMYLTMWTVYSTTHVVSRYQQLPADAVASTNAGMHFRVLKMIKTQTLKSDSGEPMEAAAHSVFVVAEIEVIADKVGPDNLCSSILVGDDGRVWETLQFGPNRLTPGFCEQEKMQDGQPFTWEQIYQIPEEDAASVYGVGIEPHTGEPVMVITPS